MAKKKSIHSDETIALYNALLTDLPDVELKGANMLYTSFNGHMFSFIAKDGEFSLRLTKEVLEEFIEKYKTEISVQHGTALKEYTLVPRKVFENTEELTPYFKQSYEMVKGLKPKPSKKK
jgi:TfoX/Sxy family transcriptional regulator of competence genes